MMYGHSPRRTPATRWAPSWRSRRACRSSSRDRSSQTQALQRFDLYGTECRSYMHRRRRAAIVGDRFGKLSVWASGNYQRQPQPAAELRHERDVSDRHDGRSSRTRTSSARRPTCSAPAACFTREMTNAKVKAAYDITPTLRAAYTFGYWQNDGNSRGRPVHHGVRPADVRRPGGIRERLLRHARAAHVAQPLAPHGPRSSRLGLRARRLDAIASTTISSARPSRVATGTTFGPAGRVAVLDGTGWETLDLKGTWHPGGPVSRAHRSASARTTITTSLHNPTYNTPDWTNGDVRSTVATEGDGKTRDEGAVGAGRVAHHARRSSSRSAGGTRTGAGSTASTSTAARRWCSRRCRRRSSRRRRVLAWTPTPIWTLTASVGKAYRFATAAELYQLVSTGATFTSPNPNLKPDNVLVAELRVERKFERAHRRSSSLFQDDVHDAIISQFLPLVASSSHAVLLPLERRPRARARRRARARQQRRAVRGLELSGSVTYVDARTLAMSGRASATAPAGSAIGKRLPNIPEWRASSRPPCIARTSALRSRSAAATAQAVHDARQRRRELQHLSGLQRLVRDGHAR